MAVHPRDAVRGAVLTIPIKTLEKREWGLRGRLMLDSSGLGSHPSAVRASSRVNRRSYRAGYRTGKRSRDGIRDRLLRFLPDAGARDGSGEARGDPRG